MFKKFLLLITLSLSCQSLLSVKIKTGELDSHGDTILDGGEFELSALQEKILLAGFISPMQSNFADGGAVRSLAVDKKTFELLCKIIGSGNTFDSECAKNVLRETDPSEFLPLFMACDYIMVHDATLLKLIAEHYLTIQPHISFDNFAQHAQCITLFFQQDCVKGLLANTATPYTCLHILTGLTNGITSIAFSPDGTKLATGFWDNTAKLCDINSSQCIQIFIGHSIRTITEHTSLILSVAFSPDGTKLVTGSNDGAVKLWDVNSRQCLHTLTDHTGPVDSVAFSPDGIRLATGSADETAKLWDVNTGQCIQTFTGHAGSVISVAFLPDGTKLVTGSWDKTAKLWDINSSHCLHTLTGLTSRIASIAFSPDGTKLAAGFWDNTARLCDVNTGQCIQTLIGHADKIISVAFSSDGTKLATGSLDKTAKLWDINTGQCIQTLVGHAGKITSVAFSPDGTKLATGSEYYTAKLWAILDTAQQVLLVWGMKNPDMFINGVLPFLDEVYASLPEQLQRKITTRTRSACSVM